MLPNLQLSQSLLVAMVLTFCAGSALSLLALILFRSLRKPVVTSTSEHTSSKAADEQAFIIKAALSSNQIGVWDWQLQTDSWFASPPYWTCLGYPPIDGPGNREEELAKVHPEDRERVADKIKALLNGDLADGYAYETRVLDATGKYRWVNVRCTVAETDANGKPTRLMGSRINIDKERKAQEKAAWLERYDHLTGLANRTTIQRFFSAALNNSDSPQKRMAFLCIDLDRFKMVNDTLGHQFGDQLLKTVASRIKECITDKDLVARMGSDDFLVLLSDKPKHVAEEIATQIQENVSAAQNYHTNELSVSACIGISHYPDNGRTFDTLYTNAGIALSVAKDQGSQSIAHYDRNIEHDYQRLSQIEFSLQRALKNNEFSIFFQPQINLETNSIMGVEALLRWHSSELGWVSPAEFIPVAEATGMIIPIGEWVLRTAIQKVKVWSEDYRLPLKLSVNLSSVQFRQKQLVEIIAEILSATNYQAELLELELTESVTMDNVQTAVEVMERIHELGVSMSIDDFGTGYSSLSYLKTLPIYKLKIDRSFVSDMIDDANDRAIVKTIIAMAKSLGLYTIAEGVETKQQLDLLVELGCEEAQGFYFSRPLPEAEIVEFLNNHITIKIAAN